MVQASSSPKEHQQHIQEIFKRLEYFGLMINAQKCIFGVPSVEFLGYQIDQTGITPLPFKIEAIKNFLVPTSLKQLRRFVGIVNYYRRFIPKCSHVLNKEILKREKRKNWYKPRAASIARSLAHGMAVKYRLKLSRMVRM